MLGGIKFRLLAEVLWQLKSKFAVQCHGILQLSERVHVSQY